MNIRGRVVINAFAKRRARMRTSQKAIPKKEDSTLINIIIAETYKPSVKRIITTNEAKERLLHDLAKKGKLK